MVLLCITQVTEDVYTSCDVAGGSLYVWGEPSVDNSAAIDNLVPGSYYFICSIAGHCDAGMRIKVDNYDNCIHLVRIKH